MRRISLTQGKFALVDDADYLLLVPFKWYAQRTPYTYYAVRYHNRSATLMHRQILGLPKGDARNGDHANHNGLDNRRINLRIVSPRENTFNRRPNIKGQSPYKGVSWHKYAQRWRAQIRNHGRKITLGYFNTDIEAALYYDEAAKIHHGKYAVLNFPCEEAVSVSAGAAS